MLKTSHMQEMKRRYASIYIPDETIDDQFNEHCGVCDEQGIEEAVLADRDYEYDGKVIKISKKNFSKVHKDFKNPTKGKETMITYDSKWGTVLVPVEFTEEVEIEEEFWAVIDKAKGGEVMAVSSDEKGAKSSVKMSNFSKHDYHFNKDPRTLKIVKVAGSYKKGEKMIGTKLSFKEEVEVDESNELQAIMALDDVGIEASINKKDQVVVKKKDLKKAEKALKKSFKRGGAPELHTEEVEMEEAVNLKKLKKEYEKNEDDNYHRENYLLLAKAFGTKSEIKKVEEIMKRSEANNSTSQKDNDWMYKNIMPYYNKIRNEEVKMDEAKGTAYPATIDTLKMIVREKQNQTVMFKSGKAIVDLFTASAMVQVYDALKKPEMKKTFEKMIGDKAGFLKTQAFAMKMISGGK
jgi:hypothetical protein